MSPKTKISAYIVNELEVSSLNGERHHSLPDVYTQKTMPVGAANIITTETLKKQPYLDNIDIPEIHAEVELLIGTNASKLLEPWEVVNSQGDGPSAIKTLLGWVINGSCGDWKGKHDDDNSHFATVKRVSVECLELLLEKQYEHNFNEKTAEDKAEMSREEAQSIEIMEQSVKVQDGQCKTTFQNKRGDNVKQSLYCSTAPHWNKEENGKG